MAILTGMSSTALALMLHGLPAGMPLQAEFNTDQEAATSPCTAPYRESLSANSVSDAEWKAIITCVFANTAAQMDAELPQRIDDITALVSTSSHGTTFRYVYVLDVAMADVRQANIDSLRAATRQNACTDESMVQTMGLGGSYFYRWVDRRGTLITSMTISSC